MKLIEIKSLENGTHRNQTIFSNIPVPDGWAIIPDNMECENFPFGEVEAEEIDGAMVVTQWTPGTIPEPEEPILAPAQQREEAYNTEAIIEWDGKILTVTQAAQQWQYYAAEGSVKATELQVLIAEAKGTIREKYPD